MDGIEEKLSSVLNDPEMMQKIMAMAQSLGSGSTQQEAPKQPQNNPLPDIDLGMLQKFSGIARQGNIDKEQQALLRALSPYLSRERIRKLENAMRAAKMARIAAAALGQQGSIFPSFR